MDKPCEVNQHLSPYHYRELDNHQRSSHTQTDLALSCPLICAVYMPPVVSHLRTEKSTEGASARIAVGYQRGRTHSST